MVKLASSSEDGVISVIDVSTGTQIFVARETTRGRPDPLTFMVWASAFQRDDDDNDDDRQNDNNNRNNAAFSRETSVPGESSPRPAPSLDRRLAGLYCGKESGELDVWDMVEGKRKGRLMNEARPVTTVDVAARVGIAVGYLDGTVALWWLKGN